MQKNILQFEVKESMRADKFLRQQEFSGSNYFSRKAWEVLFTSGNVRNQSKKRIKAGDTLNCGDLLQCSFPTDHFGLLSYQASEASKELPAKLEPLLLHSDWALFSKASGLHSYPLLPWERNSFANQVATFLEQEKILSLDAFQALAPAPSLEAGIVHRLDQYTSGIILVALTAQKRSLFLEHFKEKQFLKKYLAICLGEVASGLELEAELFRGEGDKVLVAGAKETAVALSNKAANRSLGIAKASIQTLASNGAFSLVELRTDTGLRHQVRVLMSAIGHPLVGDFKYQTASQQARQQADISVHQLHASSLQIKSGSYAELSEGVNASPPENFLENLKKLGIKY